jgi:glucose-1-phosphate cytidylyltransferase
VIATGYKSEMISTWVEQEKNRSLKALSIEILNTGLETQTAGRIRKSLEFVGEKEIMVTYGDGLGNVNLKNLLSCHNKYGRTATVTSVRPPSRFGVIQSNEGLVTHFGEKNQVDSGWINGGFFVIQKEYEKYVHSTSESFEANVLPRLVNDVQLTTFQHEGFWQPMDTLRERNELSLYAQNPKSYWLKDL